MTALPTLGRLEKVDLRVHWVNEATHFTPWLALPENLGLLNDTVGMNLQVINTEQSVGHFRADIICRDLITEDLVLIENQIERTDHNHLGQLMTYAAGLDTVNIIWIAERFTEEHRAALDWLNRITTEEFRFFGLEVELWRIGTSLAAPKFNVISKPNDWTKATRKKVEESSDRARIFRNLWGRIIQVLGPRYPALNFPSPSGIHWIRFLMKYSRLVLSYAPNAKRMSLYLLFQNEAPEEWYNFLCSDSESLNREFGKDFEWINSSEGKGYAVAKFGFNHLDDIENEDLILQIGDVIDRVRQVLQDRQIKFEMTLESSAVTGDADPVSDPAKGLAE